MLSVVLFLLSIVNPFCLLYLGLALKPGVVRGIQSSFEVPHHILFYSVLVLVYIYLLLYLI